MPKEFIESQGENEKKNFDIIKKFIKETFLDPHREDIIISKLLEEDFDLIRKFDAGILTEQEINDRLESLNNNHKNLSYHFAVMLKNKFLANGASKNKR